jgi:uncharacterized protein (TIGR02145 family)
MSPLINENWAGTRFVVYFFCIFINPAFALTGSVVDQSGTPLDEVSVTFIENGASTISDSDGNFVLEPTVGVLKNKPSSLNMQLKNNALLLSNVKSESVRLQTYSIEGKQLNSFQGKGNNGSINYSIFGSNKVASGFYFVKYQVGEASGVVKILSTSNGLTNNGFQQIIFNSANKALRKSEPTKPIIDSVLFSKSGYENKTIVISDYNEDIGQVVLDSGQATFMDERDSTVYKYVTIGSQTWMAENLNYNSGSDSYCFNDDASNCDTYGRLYTWGAAMDGTTSSSASPSGVQGICPDGWHLPSDDEWETLASYVANESGLTGYSYDDWTQIGKLLKANSDLWSFNTGTDDYGFSGLPGGYRYSSGSYINVGDYGYWWSSTENSSTGAYYRRLSSNYHFFSRDDKSKTNAYSVRCLQDPAER